MNGNVYFEPLEAEEFYINILIMAEDITKIISKNEEKNKYYEVISKNSKYIELSKRLPENASVENKSVKNESVENASVPGKCVGRKCVNGKCVRISKFLKSLKLLKLNNII